MHLLYKKAGNRKPPKQAVGCMSAVNVWLRSANRGNANNAWNVNSSGNVNNNNARNALRGCPDCFAWAIGLSHSEGTPKELKIQGAECLAFRKRFRKKSEQSRKDAAAPRGAVRWDLAPYSIVRCTYIIITERGC